MTREQRKLADELADTLEDLHDTCLILSCDHADPELIAEAQKTLKQHRDNYWNGLVVGAGQIDELLNNEQETA